MFTGRCFDNFSGLRLRYASRLLPLLLGVVLYTGVSVSHYDVQQRASAPGQLLPPFHPLPKLTPSTTELGFSSIAGKKAVRWNDADGVIHIRVENAPDVAGWTPADTKLVADAFSAWEREGAPVRFVIDSAGTTDSADVIVRWVDHFDGPMSGWTTVVWDSTGKIHRSDVRLALRTQAGQLLTPAQRLLLATHEFGHVLGLGHTNNMESIMSAVIYAHDIGPSDVASVQRLYGSLAESRQVASR
jgi:hypothetical protein